MSAGLHLIVQIAGERVALPAAEIEAVVDIGATTPVPRAAPHIAGLAALRSRVLTVIDARLALQLPAENTGGEAVVLQSDGHGYALLVDMVEDVVELDGPVEPLRVRPSRAWARVTRGIVEHEGKGLMVVSPLLLLANPAAAA